MTWDISKLKGHTISMALVGKYGEVLILDDGTEVYAGNQGVFGVQLTHCEQCGAKIGPEELEAGHNSCRPCLDRQIVRSEFNRIVNDNLQRQVAMRDSPAVAALRRQLET